MSKAPLPNAPAFAQQSDRLRETLATLAVSTRRRQGREGSDEREIQNNGFTDMQQYWGCALSEPMTATSFIYLLRSHLTDHLPDTDDLLEHHLKKSLKVAQTMKAPWLFEDISQLKVYPLAAVQWMLSMPKEKHLVPLSLAQHLSGEATKQAPTGGSGRPVGTGYKYLDEPIVRRMIEMVAGLEVPSLTKAAEAIIGKDGTAVAGSGSPEAKVRRLVARAKQVQNGE